MSCVSEGWKRQREAFWRGHHEAWKRSDLNQREYCEAQGLPLKAFGNWRAQFSREPAAPLPKLLYRRGGVSHTLNHTLSHTPGPPEATGVYPTSPLAVPPPRDGHRRRFSEEDRCRIVEEASQPGASLAGVARRYGIDRRLLHRWKEALSPPVFVSVQIVPEVGQ